MSQTSRELVIRSLKFESPDRVPRDLWILPWASTHYPETIQTIREKFTIDFESPPAVYQPSPRRKGDEYSLGLFIDEWGAVFTNIQAGIIGEVREPIIQEITNWKEVQPPYEILPADYLKAREIIKNKHENSTKFMIGGCCPRPWERYQFLRGSENAMIDIMMPETGTLDLLQVIHQFYLKELEFWASTDIDGLTFMDDWGAQNQLLIPPRLWREIFKPLYKDYCDLAHANNKFIFMHSDGHIAEIYEDLIEIGVDAVNSQLFCMDMEDLQHRAKGKITFWGEIDRQHVLPNPNPEVGREAVRKVAQYLYDPSGGVIAQFEFGAGANPETAMVIFEEWDRIQTENKNKGKI
ncbi:methyltransferase [candidate division KSB1 bacterium]|nr:methyltransferase [candidate division KSB1 bacterium]